MAPSTTPAATQARDLIARVFSTRPRIEAVAEDLIKPVLREAYPEVSAPLWELAVARVQSSGVDTYREVETLSDLVLRRCLQRRALNFAPGYHRLVRRTGTSGTISPVAGTSIDEIERLLNRVGASLLERFQARLVAYWSETSRHDPLSTRWSLVARQLHSGLLRAPQNPPLSPFFHERLLGRLRPVKADRHAQAGEESRIFQVYAAGEGEAGEWIPALVLYYSTRQATKICLYSPGDSLLVIDSLDALSALLPHYLSRYSPGLALEWALVEPEGDAFEALAQSVLEKQLRDLSVLAWSDFPGLNAYKQRIHQLTSPLAWFEPATTDSSGVTDCLLPGWLRSASPADRLGVARRLDQLADVQRDAAGMDFMDGLEPIDRYARTQLQARMRQDYPREVMIDPDHYLLTFTRTQGGTVGWTEKTSQTLTLSALENPFTRPYAVLEISNRIEPGYVPGWWITPRYLESLITRVNIGRNYPALLRKNLLDDPREVERRCRLFVHQSRSQLPLVAVEAYLRGRRGMTAQGVRLIDTLMVKGVGNGQNVVVRPLAFLAHAGAKAHVAANLFVIGERDAAQAPHVLYRPDAPETLEQFATRQHLLDAIARSGPLQNLVLSRLDEPGRALFGNGGFLQPHTQRYLAGDEFAPVKSSGAALLSDEEVQGDFLQRVFSDNARQLVALADQQSVSNEEFRWRAFLDNLRQLFNAVLPMVSGPLASAGWLYQTLSSLRAWVQPGQAADGESAAATIAELISSVAAALSHHALSLNQRLGIAPDRPAFVPRAVSVPARRLPDAAPLRARSPADLTPMPADFSWSSASQQLSASQLREISRFKWPQRGRPWPVTAQNTETQGATKGLIRVPIGPQTWQLHAYIDGGLYPVGRVPGGVRVKWGDSLGPWVRSDQSGNWSFDLSLRLRGGMQAQGEPVRLLTVELARDYALATDQVLEATRKVEVVYELYDRIHKTQRERFTDQHRATVNLRYLEQLQVQGKAQLERIAVFKRKNEDSPIAGFERELIEQLEHRVENLRYQMQRHVLARKDVTPPRETLEAWQAQIGAEDAALSTAANESTLAYLRKKAEHQEALIELSAEEQGLLGELDEVPGFDRSVSSVARVDTSDLLPLDWKVPQISLYQVLSVKRLPEPEEFYDFILYKQLTDRAGWVARTHRSALEPDLISAAERIALLDDVTGQYGEVLAGLGSYQQRLPNLLDRDFSRKLAGLIMGLQQDAEYQLALLIKAQDERAPEPAPVPARPGPSQPEKTPVKAKKRLVRTDDKRVLVGRVRERTPELEGEVVDVIDPVDKQHVGTYQQKAGGRGWDEIEVKKALPPPRRSLANLWRDARHLLARVPVSIDEGWNDAATSTSPIGIESTLLEDARVLGNVVEDITQALQQREERGGGAASTTETKRLADLSQARILLMEQGRLLRIQVIKNNPPEGPRIQYLKEQGEVEVLMIEGRVKLRSEHDYLLEYVVIDRRKKPLAYAHFHYRDAQSPLAAFTTAHLKLPAQRYVSFVTAVGQTERQRIAVHRAIIDTSLAQSLFFPVTASRPRGGGQTYW